MDSVILFVEAALIVAGCIVLIRSRVRVLDYLRRGQREQFGERGDRTTRNATPGVIGAVGVFGMLIGAVFIAGGFFTLAGG